MQIICDLSTTLLLVDKRFKVDTCMQITVVQKHLLDIVACCLGKFMAIDHRLLAKTTQYTVTPLCRVETREGVGIQWNLYKAEPLCIGFLSDIILGLGCVLAIGIGNYRNIVEQILALGNELFHRAREQQKHAQERKNHLSQQCHHTKILIAEP